MATRSEKINILFLIGNFRLSGAFRIAWEIALRLPKSHYQIVIVSLSSANHSMEQKNRLIAENNGIKTYSLDIINRGRMLTILDIARILKRHKIDIIHTHSDPCDTYGRIAALFARTPIRVVTVHNMAPHPNKKVRGFIIDKILALSTSKFVAVSHSIAAFTQRRLGLRNSKITTIYNGIEPDKFAEIYPRADVRKNLGLSPGKIVIGCVGLIYPIKGQHFLIKAAQILEKTRNDFQIVMFGEGQGLRTIDEEIKRSKISSVILCGWCDDKNIIYSSIDIIVIPSVIEGLPLVMLEAFASGIPVVATSVGAIPDLLINEETGILVQPSDPNALAHGIMKLMDDKILCNKIIQKAKNLVIRLCDVNTMVKNYKMVYDDIYYRFTGN